jgi:hypothetical protein
MSKQTVVPGTEEHVTGGAEDANERGRELLQKPATPAEAAPEPKQPRAKRGGEA